MKPNTIFPILCICMYICCMTEKVYAFNTADNYYFRHYTNRDGLSHNTVYCSLQDKRGFIWFGTDDGLNRFDGYSFRIFRYDELAENENTLLNNRILSLYEDTSGKIWVCTLGGVCYYDYETNSFHPFRLDLQSPILYSEHVVEDGDGNLWFRDFFTITKYNPVTKSSRIYKSDDYHIHTTAITMPEKGIPVFSDAMSLFLYNSDTDKFNTLVSLYDFVDNKLNVITSLLEIPQAGFLIGTDLEGLIFYNQSNHQLETIIPDIHVRSIMQFNPNIYWIASESGAFIYNLIDKSLINLRKSLINDYTIADNAVYSVMKDREGGVWVGSFFGGINYLPKTHNQFTRYIARKTHPGMIGNSIREICPDQYGNIWLGTEDNGINHFNPVTNKMVHYSSLDEDHPLSATNIHGLYVEGDTLWIGYFNKGIDLLHIPSGKILKNYDHANTNNGLISNFVLCFCKTKSGDLLIGTAAGVVLYNKKTKIFSKWQAADGMVRQIIEDSKHNIWVATNNGLYRYTPPHIDANGVLQEEALTRYEGSRFHNGKSLGAFNNTTSVFEDSKGRIWLTSYFGLLLYNTETDSFSRITTKDGLPSDMVYRIVEDENNMFWISTANGLVRFNPETFVIHTYSYTDGLHETQFNFSSSYRDQHGTIYMGTVNGMISFQPQSFTKDTHEPSLYITRVQVADNPQKDKFLITNTSGKAHELKLPYNSATFTISYIALCYTSPDAVKYEYILEGSDNDWVSMGKNREVTFASLAPGKYTFRVRSTNSNDIWQRNEQVMHIVITPPFWATRWAILIYVFLLSGLAVAFYKYKKRSFIKKAQRNQELFEVEKEKELYNAKIQFFTFITHEIRTPLTLIKAPLEKIIHSGDGTANTKQHLDIIAKNTQRLLDLSNQLLDFRKTESRGFRLNFVKTDIVFMLENILASFTPVIQSEKKKLTVDLPEKHLFAYIDRDALTKIITNLLTNACKYSAGSIALRLISPEKAETDFQIVVTNDGHTVPEKEYEHIFTPFYRLKQTENIQGSGIGLSLSRTLADFHKGSLIYKVTTAGLNQFVLTLPVRQEDYNFDLSEKADQEQVIASNPDKQTLLIVEDQRDMRLFLVEEFSTEYDVIEAENGKEALIMLERNRIDLIISDIMMPEMDGFELCEKVKNEVEYSHIPFILLTAQHNLQSRIAGLSQGADAYLEKPFSLEHLCAQVKNLLTNRERLRRAYLEKPLIPTSSLAVSSVDNQFLEKLNRYIETNLTNEHLSVDMLALEMNMSNSSLYRKVKAISDLSPVDFIRMARLKKAVQLMQSGEKRISEIAYQVGFSSPAYFSTTFQKQYGKSPSEFMKELG